MSFNSLSLGQELLNNLINEKIEDPYPIQEQAIPLELTEGVVHSILTESKNHPHVVKVKLKNRQVGRIKKIFDKLHFE